VAETRVGISLSAYWQSRGDTRIHLLRGGERRRTRKGHEKSARERERERARLKEARSKDAGNNYRNTPVNAAPPLRLTGRSPKGLLKAVAAPPPDVIASCSPSPPPLSSPRRQTIIYSPRGIVRNL